LRSAEHLTQDKKSANFLRQAAGFAKNYVELRKMRALAPARNDGVGVARRLPGLA
jgi:hypothetical protein